MKFEFSTFKTVASCSLMMFANYSLSAQETFKINAETIKVISNNESFIYPVENREIDYYPFVEGKVRTESYQNFLDSQEDLKESYNDYISDSNNNSERNSKRLKIIELLNSYISNSKDEKSLDKAYRLSNDLHLKYIIENNSSSYNGWGVKPKKALYIKDENGKYASKAMLKEYLSSITNDKNFENKISQSYQSKKYLQKLEEEKEMTESEKYEVGQIKSEKLSKRKTYIVLKNQKIKDFSTIYGTYKEISSTMLISNEEVENRFLENELSDDVRKYYGSGLEKYNTLIENLQSGKLYVMPYRVYQNIMNQNLGIKVEETLINLGYKINENNGYKFINTKHYKVSCDASLYNILSKNKDYLKQIDSWFEQMQNLRKQTITYNSKIDNYIRLYRLQRNRMSRTDISAWSALTKSAMTLNKQFVALNDKMWNVNYEILDKNYLKNSNEFDDYLSASMGALGL